MKKILMLIFALLTIFAINSCNDSPQGSDTNEESNMPLDISIIRLIANPADYHGAFIRVDGVANLSVGATAIYLSKEHWFYLSSRNGLWLDIEQNVIIDEGTLLEHWYYINGEWVSYEDVQYLNGKYVIIEGIFDMYAIGNRGRYPGGIVDITRISDFSDIHRNMFIDPENRHYIGDIDD